MAMEEQQRNDNELVTPLKTAIIDVPSANNQNKIFQVGWRHIKERYSAITNSKRLQNRKRGRVGEN